MCEKYLKKGICGKQMLFNDETQIKLDSFVKYSIRLIKENQEKLKTGNIEAYKLINREKRKFEIQ